MKGKIDMTRSVGETNGRISWLFRINQVLIPVFCLLFSVVFVPWATFVTKNVILNTGFREEGDRWTKAQDETAMALIKEWHHTDIKNTLPPPWLVQKVEKNSADIDRLENR